MKKLSMKSITILMNVEYRIVYHNMILFMKKVIEQEQVVMKKSTSL